MSTVRAFLGIVLISLVASLLAALQLADFFRAEEEFVAVMLTLVALNAVSAAIYGGVYARAQSVRPLAVTALLLCAAVAVLVALPAIVDIHAGRTTVADSFRGQNLEVSLELLGPAAIAILVQWGLARHRWLKERGREVLSLWPWVTTVVAAIAILHPLGLAIIKAAIVQSPTDWLRELWLTTAEIGAAVLLAMAGIEYYIRRRVLGRRLGARRP